MTGNPPKVFISYSHDTVAHQERVLGLADRLRADGIDAEFDQYNLAPPEGWPLWCEQQIEAADFVLMVCTETYHRRVSGNEEQGQGLGVVWEARIIRQRLYDAGAVSTKFVPVLFSDVSPEHIPTPVKGISWYVVDRGSGYEDLYRRLTGQPRLLRPALGKIRPLPTRKRQWSERTIGAASSRAATLPPDAALTTRGTSMKKDFFVSYGSADEPWASWIAWQLEEAGYTTFFQAWDSNPGQNFVHYMEEGMRRSERIIAVITQAYLESDYARAEWYATFKRDPIGETGTLVPIRVQSCDPGSLLGPIVYIDLVGLDEAEAGPRLLAGVKKGRVKPLEAPPYPLTKPPFPGTKVSSSLELQDVGARPIYDLIKLKHSLAEAYQFGRVIQDEFQSLGSGHISNLTKPALEEVQTPFMTHLGAFRDYFSLYTYCYSARIVPLIYRDLDNTVARVATCLDVIHSYVAQSYVAQTGSASYIRLFEHFEEVKSSIRTFEQIHADVVDQIAKLLHVGEAASDSIYDGPHEAPFPPPNLYGKVKHLQKVCDQLIIKADAYVKQVVSVLFLVLEEHNA